MPALPRQLGFLVAGHSKPPRLFHPNQFWFIVLCKILKYIYIYVHLIYIYIYKYKYKYKYIYIYINKKNIYIYIYIYMCIYEGGQVSMFQRSLVQSYSTMFDSLRPRD